MISRYSFKVGQKYTRKDVYSVVGVPDDKQGGAWDTGYTKWIDDWFIFCNVGVPGRTGHDYGNHFVGDDLIWYGKTTSRLKQPSIQALISPIAKVYLFYRDDDRSPFTFAGHAKAVHYEDASPVKVVWGFPYEAESRPEVLPEEVLGGETFVEGATKTIRVNVYERNPQARAKCLEIYGVRCSACEFDFGSMYGAIGDGFIHVHHLKQLSDIGKSYELDPALDLLPVCPNCHAMLHRRNPPYSIDELREMMRSKRAMSNVP